MSSFQDGNMLSSTHPDVAVLTKTLGSGSATKWIIPARIRNASRNDIVFISDTSIQLREFVTSSEPHLVEVTGNLNFQVSILAAKVITAQTEPLEGIDVFTNQNGEEERYVLGNGCLPEDHPAQILVLSLASSELAFVYAHEQLDGIVSFQWARKPLISGVDLPDKFARHLAIDPKSRALAFAPSMGYFAIASLPPLDQLKSSIGRWRPSSPNSFLPWIELRLIQVDGYVVKMDFLQNADGRRSKLILMLLVANAGQTSLLLYRWDTEARLRHVKPMPCSGQVLRSEDSFPLMLIPCKALASFLIVTETELVVYSQVTASKARRLAYPLDDTRSKASVQIPPSHKLLWTQWAKPRRHKKYNSINDDVMLVREDGLLKLFVVEHELQPKVRFLTEVDRLEFNVDSAFCMLPAHASISGGDILIAGGNMNNGGVFHLQARQSLSPLQVLSNAAPFHDVLLVNPKISRLPNIGERRVYACSGQNDGAGGLVQIHHGIAARLDWHLPHSDVTSIERVWTIEVQDEGLLLFLLSHSVHTSLISHKVGTMEYDHATADTHPGFEFDSTTLAASTVEDDVFVQLTAQNINILSLSHKFLAIRREFKIFRPLCAAIMEHASIASVAYPMLEGFAISIFDVRRKISHDEALVLSAKLHHQPLTLQMAMFNKEPIVFVATDQGRLTAFRVTESLNLIKLFEHNLSDIDETVEDSTISSLCFLSRDSNPVGVLLCGLRSGWLLCIELRADKQDPAGFRILYQSAEPFRLGSTVVSTSPDVFGSRRGSTTSAFAVCQTSLKHVSLKDNTAGADFSVSSVFVTESEKPSAPFPTINAVHRVQRLNFDPTDAMNGRLICVTAENIRLCSLITQSGSVLQKTPVSGVPRRMIMSQFLKQMIIGVDSPTGPRVIFLTPSAKDSDQITYTPSDSVIVGSATQRIRSLMNYKPTNGKQHYEFLVIALNSRRLDPRSSALVTTGSVVCLSLKRILRGKADSSKAQLVIRLPGNEVTAICVCGATSMLVGTNRSVILHDFVLETREWKKLSEYDLPSAAVSIEVKEAMIFVATQRHSLMQFKESKGNLVLVESDTTAQNMLQVLTYGGVGKKTAVLMSVGDKGTTVTGVAEDPITGRMGRVWEGGVPLLVEKLVEETQGLGGDRERTSFCGVTKDGTQYRFLTLKREEFELLKWLEGLCKEEKGGVGGKRRLARRVDRQALSGEMQGGGRALSTHVNGDVLEGLVETGVMGLREVLEPRVKEEDEDEKQKAKREEKVRELRELARPLVGEMGEDVVGKVIIWLRRMLN